MLVGHIHGWQVLKQQRQQVGNNEQTDPALNTFVKVASDFRVQQPGVKPLAQRQVGGDVRARFSQLEAHKTGLALQTGAGWGVALHQKVTSVERPA